eukprot:3173155-Amphidinium_carterae.1
MARRELLNDWCSLSAEEQFYLEGGRASFLRQSTSAVELKSRSNNLLQETFFGNFSKSPTSQPTTRTSISPKGVSQHAYHEQNT